MSALVQIPVAEIRRNPLNPRGEVDPAAEGTIKLATSMDQVGLVQAVTVMEDPDGGYILLAGERRTTAARIIPWETIEAKISPSLNVIEQLDILCVENLQREDLKPCEEARTFAKYTDEAGLSQREVALRLGCDQSHVSRRLDLLKLSKKDQAAVDDGTLAVSKALKSLKPKKAKPEPITIPDSLRPDPIDAMEPLGYKVLTLDANGAYQDDWDSEIFPSLEAVRSDIANTEFHGEPHILVPVALVLLPPVEVSTGTQEPSPADVESDAGGEEEGLAVPVSDASTSSDTGPLATAIDEGLADGIAAAAGVVAEAVAPPEELTDERKAALVHFAKTWGEIKAADEQTVRESAEHEFFDSPGDAERAVKLWQTAREQLSQRAAS